MQRSFPPPNVQGKASPMHNVEVRCRLERFFVHYPPSDPRLVRMPTVGSRHWVVGIPDARFDLRGLGTSGISCVFCLLASRLVCKNKGHLRY